MHKSKRPSNLLLPTQKEIKTLYKLTVKSLDHMSGCSFDVLALWSKGSSRIYAGNRLNRPAETLSEGFPAICGQHAEQSLITQFPTLSGGTLYVAGTRNTSRAFMNNTLPCKYCVPLILDTQIRFVVYFQDGTPTKIDTRELRV